MHTNSFRNQRSSQASEGKRETEKERQNQKKKSVVGHAERVFNAAIQVFVRGCVSGGVVLHKAAPRSPHTEKRKVDRKRVGVRQAVGRSVMDKQKGNGTRHNASERVSVRQACSMWVRGRRSTSAAGN